MLTPIPYPLSCKEQTMKTAVVSRQEQKLWQEGEEISPRADASCVPKQTKVLFCISALASLLFIQTSR